MVTACSHVSTMLLHERQVAADSYTYSTLNLPRSMILARPAGWGASLAAPRVKHRHRCSACSGRPTCMNLDTAQLPPLPLWGSFYIVDGCQPEHAGISCGTTGKAQAPCSACSGRPACMNLDTAQLPPLPLWGSLYVVPNRKTQKNRLRALLNSIFFAPAARRQARCARCSRSRGPGPPGPRGGGRARTHRNINLPRPKVERL